MGGEGVRGCSDFVDVGDSKVPSAFIVPSNSFLKLYSKSLFYLAKRGNNIMAIFG